MNLPSLCFDLIIPLMNSKEFILNLSSVFVKENPRGFAPSCPVCHDPTVQTRWSWRSAGTSSRWEIIKICKRACGSANTAGPCPGRPRMFSFTVRAGRHRSACRSAKHCNVSMQLSGGDSLTPCSSCCCCCGVCSLHKRTEFGLMQLLVDRPRRSWCGFFFMLVLQLGGSLICYLQTSWSLRLSVEEWAAHKRWHSPQQKWGSGRRPGRGATGRPRREARGGRRSDEADINQTSCPHLHSHLLSVSLPTRWKFTFYLYIFTYGVRFLKKVRVVFFCLNSNKQRPAVGTLIEFESLRFCRWGHSGMHGNIVALNRFWRQYDGVKLMAWFVKGQSNNKHLIIYFMIMRFIMILWSLTSGWLLRPAARTYYLLLQPLCVLIVDEVV